MADQPPYDPNPMKLCPDPQLGTRDGWTWCSRCAAIREPAHTCYRPASRSCNRHMDCDHADWLAEGHAREIHCIRTDCAPLCTPDTCVGGGQP